MNDLTKTISFWLGLVIWTAGTVLAKGFWSTIFAVCIPFWSMYLIVEKVFVLTGFI